MNSSWSLGACGYTLLGSPYLLSWYVLCVSEPCCVLVSKHPRGELVNIVSHSVFEPCYLPSLGPGFELVLSFHTVYLTVLFPCTVLLGVELVLVCHTVCLQPCSAPPLLGLSWLLQAACLCPTHGIFFSTVFMSPAACQACCKAQRLSHNCLSTDEHPLLICFMAPAPIAPKQGPHVCTGLH